MLLSLTFTVFPIERKEFHLFFFSLFFCISPQWTVFEHSSNSLELSNYPNVLLLTDLCADYWLIDEDCSNSSTCGWLRMSDCTDWFLKSQTFFERIKTIKKNRFLGLKFHAVFWNELCKKNLYSGYCKSSFWNSTADLYVEYTALIHETSTCLCLIVKKCLEGV
jgi:hypothetical protein